MNSLSVSGLEWKSVNISSNVFHRGNDSILLSSFMGFSFSPRGGFHMQRIIHQDILTLERDFVSVSHSAATVNTFYRSASPRHGSAGHTRWFMMISKHNMKNVFLLLWICSGGGGGGYIPENTLQNRNQNDVSQHRRDSGESSLTPSIQTGNLIALKEVRTLFRNSRKCLENVFLVLFRTHMQNAAGDNPVRHIYKRENVSRISLCFHGDVFVGVWQEKLQKSWSHVQLLWKPSRLQCLWGRDKTLCPGEDVSCPFSVSLVGRSVKLSELVPGCSQESVRIRVVLLCDPLAEENPPSSNI